MKFLTKLLVLISIYLCFSSTFLSAQTDFKWPLDIPVFFSGTFGELRASHFHAGIDIKTQGVTGKPVFAVAEGYVSRIKIQTNGYGKSLYIHHPNGYTSVYAHLNNYIPEIADYVKEEQYKNQSYTLDIYLEAGKVPVKNGQTIAYSGNTGGSSGPHLHFEIRETDSQKPVNALKFYSDVKDNIKPKIYNLAVYPMDKKSQIDYKNSSMIFQPLKSHGDYRIDQVIKVSGVIGFGVETYDFINGSSNRCGVYSIELFVDSTLYYHHEIESFSFYETRYINSHIDYELYKRDRKKIQKLFIDPNNKLSIYKYLENKGRFDVEPGDTHKIYIRVADIKGNYSSLEFFVVGTKGNFLAIDNKNQDFIEEFNYDVVNTYSSDNINILIPAYSLYKNIDFTYAVLKHDTLTYSDIQIIHNEYTPVHKAYTVSIKPKYMPDENGSKLYMASINEKGECVYEGNTWHGDLLQAKTRSFGKFVILSDNNPPRVSADNLYVHKAHNKSDTLRFTVLDEESGIKHYTGIIDGKWALFEYDPKNNLIFYTIDESRLISGLKHKLELEVEDRVGNKNNFTSYFYY